MPTFTAYTGNKARGVTCYGANHSDHGPLGTCDGCGATVVKAHQGHLADAPIASGGYGHRFACWNFHHCDDHDTYLKKVGDAEHVLAGDLVKNTPVEVVKGRKVPVGTLGLVKVHDPDGAYGPRVGLAVDGTERLTWTAASNVEARWDAEQVAQAQTIVDEWNAQHQAWGDAVAAAEAEIAAVHTERQTLLAESQALPEAERAAFYTDQVEAKLNAGFDRIVEATNVINQVKQERGY